MMAEDYIKELSTEEKIVFLKIICKLIKADGSIDEDEIAFLKQTAEIFGVDNNAVLSVIQVADSIDYVAEARKITNRSHALQLIKELCALANVDDDLDDKELDIIIDSAHAMNIEDEKIILINRWVLDSQIVAQTGRIIMEENNG
jgi:uncharacterized tellurite resistance protein B-like protein